MEGERDVWWWWRKALDGGVIGGPELPVHADVPQPGFYRFKRGKGIFEPAAIWWRGELDENGEPNGDETLVCVVGFKPQKANPENLWTYLCRNPISKHAYDEAVKTGQWADVDPAVNPRVVIGNNAPDQFEVLSDQIQTVLDAASEYKIIEDATTAARAQGLRARANELANEADKLREVEKRPHFEAAKAVDGKWQPLVKSAKAGADALKAALNAYATALAKAEADARAAALAAMPDEAIDTTDIPEASKEFFDKAKLITPAPTQIRGGYGRAASVRVVKVIVGVSDWDALFGLVRHELLVQEVMIAAAQKLLNSGVAVPGVVIEEQRRVA